MFYSTSCDASHCQMRGHCGVGKRLENSSRRCSEALAVATVPVTPSLWRAGRCLYSMSKKGPLMREKLALKSFKGGGEPSAWVNLKRGKSLSGLVPNAQWPGRPWP